MIPKIIHYCWFGGNPLPLQAKKCIKSWKKICPDYQIIRWDESNFDIAGCPPYVRQAYSAQKWAFVADFARLKIIYENGGIYLDTDITLLKRPDALLAHPAYFGWEDNLYVNTGLGFGAEKASRILHGLMSDYLDIPFFLNDGKMDLTPCPVRNTNFFLQNGLKQGGSKQVLNDGTLILPVEYLCPIDVHTMKQTITENTYSIHHFAGTWLSGDVAKRQKYKIHKQRIEKRYGVHMAGIYESFYYARKSNGGNGVYPLIKKIVARKMLRK